jgi:hypothetical protein
MWYEVGVDRRTFVVHPKKILERQDNSWMQEPEAWCVGFDHRWLVEQIKKTHRLKTIQE